MSWLMEFSFTFKTNVSLFFMDVFVLWIGILAYSQDLQHDLTHQVGHVLGVWSLRAWHYSSMHKPLHIVEAT